MGRAWAVVAGWVGSVVEVASLEGGGAFVGAWLVCGAAVALLALAGVVVVEWAAALGCGTALRWGGAGAVSLISAARSLFRRF